MSRRFDVLIVGGGHGGAQAAIALRQRGFSGTLAIVGEEANLPYERPPLSKDYLAGDKAFERIMIRPAAFWAEREIAMLTGHRVAALVRAAGQVRPRNGSWALPRRVSTSTASARLLAASCW